MFMLTVSGRHYYALSHHPPTIYKSEDQESGFMMLPPRSELTDGKAII